MTNKEIARALKQTARLLALTDAGAFRIRAYERAARTVQELDQPVADMPIPDALVSLPGIGKGIASQIAELLARGSHTVLDELLSAVPPGLMDVLRIRGLGPGKVRTLWHSLGVTSLRDLEQAALSGQLSALPGFGEKTIRSLLEQIALVRTYLTRRRYADVYPAADALFGQWSATEGVERVALTGAFRRGLETVDGLDLLLVLTEGSPAEATWLACTPGEPAPVPCRTTLLPDGFPVRLFRTTPVGFGTALFETTGSDVFLEGWISMHGPLPRHREEAELFEAAGEPFLAPELRETWPPLRLPEARLITVTDLCGSLHNHSTYSDGAHTLAEMANAALERDLAYFGICDHSRSLRIARGMDLETVRRQQAEIHALNEARARRGDPFRILSGIESDILEDGGLDYPDDVLASFDLVVASVHSGFNMSREQATARIVRAVANPYTDILGHPTGRLLLTREGYPVDHDAILDACARHGVAIELNASPHRLDLDWRWIGKATQRGIPIAINPDAHAIDQLDQVQWGVVAARKGGLTPEMCLNAWPLDRLRSWLVERKKGAVTVSRAT